MDSLERAIRDFDGLSLTLLEIRRQGLQRPLTADEEATVLRCEAARTQLREDFPYVQFGLQTPRSRPGKSLVAAVQQHQRGTGTRNGTKKRAGKARVTREQKLKDVRREIGATVDSLKESQTNISRFERLRRLRETEAKLLAAGQKKTKPRKSPKPSGGEHRAGSRKKGKKGSSEPRLDPRIEFQCKSCKASKWASTPRDFCNKCESARRKSARKSSSHPGVRTVVSGGLPG